MPRMQLCQAMCLLHAQLLTDLECDDISNATLLVWFVVCTFATQVPKVCYESVIHIMHEQ